MPGSNYITPVEACRVLIIDDDRDFAESIHELLVAKQLQSAFICNADELIPILESFQPHIALIDIRLKNGDGVEVLRKIHEQYPAIICIMITGHAKTETAVEAIRYQAYDYLRKPVDAEDLLGSISRAYEKVCLQMQQKASEFALLTERDFVSSILDTTAALVLLLDRNACIIRFNKACENLTGYKANEVLGKQFFPLFMSAEEATISIDAFNTIIETGENIVLENNIQTRDGKLRFISWSNTLMPATNGSDEYVLATGLDITEAHRLSNQLSYQATYDSLTGLVNRMEFEQRLNRVLKTAKENDSEHALCYLDLDQFKVINDTSGHVAGDEMLRQLGQRLQSQVRKRDTLARLGGDEFGILFENCTIDQARNVANQIRESVQEFRFVWEDKSFSVGVSLGLVPIDGNSEGIIEIMRAADNACYTAKDQGRNRVHIYSPDDDELTKRHGEMQWISRINKALEEDKFHLYYQLIQPINPVSETDNSHYEVLLRLIDDDAGPILPDNFLPAIERYGLAPRLDRWVLKHVFDWFKRHPKELEGLSVCSINVSGHSLVDNDYLKLINELFDEGIVPAEKICLEITETAAIANLSNATRFINELKQRGCVFALDDFGSGLSSFAYLKNLPVDYLKIDGMFIKDILNDPFDLAMVKSINDVGHVMGKKTIAEFVEDKGVLEELRNIGVDYVQGYAISKPAPFLE